MKKPREAARLNREVEQAQMKDSIFEIKVNRKIGRHNKMNAQELHQRWGEIILQALNTLRKSNHAVLADYVNDRGKYADVAARMAARELGMVELVVEVEHLTGQKILQPLHREIYQDEEVTA